MKKAKTIEDLINHIKSFRELKYDWDSYGGSPPGEKIIDKTIDIINRLWKRNVKFDYVFPASSEMIQLELDGKYNDLELEVYSDGFETSLIVYDKDGNEINTLEIESNWTKVINIINMVSNDIEYEKRNNT